MRKLRLTPDNILREARALNDRVNGGWATISAHPLWFGRWVIQVIPLCKPGARPMTIATGTGSLRALITEAHQWIDERADPDSTFFEVEQYISSDEYLNWCGQLGRSA